MRQVEGVAAAQLHRAAARHLRGHASTCRSHDVRSCRACYSALHGALSLVHNAVKWVPRNHNLMQRLNTEQLQETPSFLRQRL